MSEKKMVILTKEQGILIQNQAFAPDSYFHPILSKYMEIMISEEEVDACQLEEFQWLKMLPKRSIADTNCQPNCSESDLIIDQSPILYKIEDYLAKTVTIAYQCNEGRKEIIVPMIDGATTMGYALDMEAKIISNQSA